MLNLNQQDFSLDLQVLFLIIQVQAIYVNPKIIVIRVNQAFFGHLSLKGGIQNNDAFNKKMTNTCFFSLLNLRLLTLCCDCPLMSTKLSNLES